MKEKMTKILKNMKIEIKNNFEFIEGLREDGRGLDTLLIYSIDDDSVFVMYKATGNIYFQNNKICKLVNNE